MQLKIRLLILPLFILLNGASAQSLTGLVLDKASRLPIANALVLAANAKLYSLHNGYFTIAKVKTGDTVRVLHTGCKPYQFIAQMVAKPDTVKILLEPVSLILDEVRIKATRNAKSDSLRNREMFSAVFNSKPVGIKDVMIHNAVTKYIPYNYVSALNNTTTLVSVNLLQVFGLFAPKKVRTSKLQKTLIANEQYTYRQQKFSKQKVNAITGLKGDSLQVFTDKYEPPIVELQNMTDYDMMLYIKKCYAEFTAPHSN